jgi:hypothetical protein
MGSRQNLLSNLLAKRLYAPNDVRTDWSTLRERTAAKRKSDTQSDHSQQLHSLTMQLHNLHFGITCTTMAQHYQRTAAKMKSDTQSDHLQQLHTLKMLLHNLHIGNFLQVHTTIR